MKQILLNVLDNSIKYNKKNGSIAFSIKECEMNDGKAMIQFDIQDTGIGMSEEFLPHAFEMFSQEKETSRTGYEGSGLGLTIARELSERLGGSIGLTSQKGTGTTVKITLPFRISDREALALCPTRKSFWR